VPAGLREDDVADLLECVIQIKALEASIARLRHLAGTVAVTNHPRFDALLAQLVDAERRVARAWQATHRSAAHRNHSGSDSDEFIALRRANLEVLQVCTAADLASRVTWPGRGHTTVADLVAIMLAHDTEVLGELRLLPIRKSFPE
jgi:hypothetical protein